jgi:hypothetical protein
MIKGALITSLEGRNMMMDSIQFPVQATLPPQSRYLNAHLVLVETSHAALRAPWVPGCALASESRALTSPALPWLRQAVEVQPGPGLGSQLERWSRTQSQCHGPPRRRRPGRPEGQSGLLVVWAAAERNRWQAPLPSEGGAIIK